MARLEHSVLARSASGLRHIRWAREVLGTLSGFSPFEAHLSEPQRAALAAEIERLTRTIGTLSAAVKAYRDYLERARTLSRGKLRVAEYMVSGSAGIASPPGPREAETARAQAEAELASVIEPERRHLRKALERAIHTTRTDLRAMDERLAGAFSPRFVDVLYPPLTADGTRVLDDEDPDDDATGGP
jgi:hypothetical protein